MIDKASLLDGRDEKVGDVVNTEWSHVTNRAVYGINTDTGSLNSINSKELESLKNSVESWGEFLRNVFLSSTQGYISNEAAAEIALRDTELYLDVKIQLSQCMGSVTDQGPVREIDQVCSEIRKISYNFVAVTIPKLSDNSRQLVEMKQNPALHQSESIDSPSSLAHQDDLTINRKQVMTQVQRQHREVIRQLYRLNRKIGSTLVSDEYEL